jgi:hypothetical protein
MSGLKNRVLKIEQSKESIGLVVIAVNEGETNEQAYIRLSPGGSVKPKVVIYASPLDVLL